MGEPSSSSSRSSLARRARQSGGFDSDETDAFRRSAWLLLLDLASLEPRLEEARKRRREAIAHVPPPAKQQQQNGEQNGLHADYIELDAEGWQVSNGHNGLAQQRGQEEGEEMEEEEDEGWQIADSKRSRRRRGREQDTGGARERETSVTQSADTSRTDISSAERSHPDSTEGEQNGAGRKKKSGKKKKGRRQESSGPQNAASQSNGNGIEGREAERISVKATDKEQDEAPHRDEEQVGLDIRRSFVGFKDGPLADVKVRERRRRQLQDVIRSVLRRRRGLHYYQGYHDIISIFLLVLVPLPAGEASISKEQSHDLEGVWSSQDELACVVEACERLSLHYLRDNMTSNLDPTLGQLKLMRNLLREAEPALARRIEVASPLPHFAISWLISLFSHDVPLPQSRRIFDFILTSSNGPASIIYIATALVIWNKDLIMGDARDDESADPAELHHLLSKLPITLDQDRSATLFQDEADGLLLPSASDTQLEQEGQLACVLELADNLAKRFPLDEAPALSLKSNEKQRKRRVDDVMGPHSVLNTWPRLPHVGTSPRQSSLGQQENGSNGAVHVGDSSWQQADAFADMILSKSSQDVSLVVVDAMPSPPPSPTVEKMPLEREKRQRRKPRREGRPTSTTALVWVGAGAVGVVSAAALIMYGSEAITSGDLHWAGRPLVEALWSNVRL